jgi:hypothetical protein
MIVETRVREKFPALAPAQMYWALNEQYDRALDVQHTLDLGADTLPAIRRAYIAMSGAAAYVRDELLENTQFSDFYRPLKEWSLSEQLVENYHRYAANPSPARNLSWLIKWPNYLNSTGFFAGK